MKKTVFTVGQMRILKRYGVLAVYLFGSRALNKHSALSDYDYAVITKSDKHRKGGRLYYVLHEMLSSISPRTLANDVIDIVFLHQAGLELKFHVIRYGKVLYDADSSLRLNFEQKTMVEYCDYRPLLDMFDRAILESI